jgi:hypothetical protein
MNMELIAIMVAAFVLTIGIVRLLGLLMGFGVRSFRG